MVTKSRKGVVHCVAHCSDCQKSWSWYKTARQNAYNHARKTGHTVRVEVGSAFTYNPKGD